MFAKELQITSSFKNLHDFILNRDGHLDEFLYSSENKSNKFSKAYSFGSDAIEFISGGVKFRITTSDKTAIDLSNYVGYSCIFVSMFGSNPSYSKPCELIIDEQNEQLMLICYTGMSGAYNSYDTKTNVIPSTYQFPIASPLSTAVVYTTSNEKLLYINDDASCYDDTSICGSTGMNSYMIISSPRYETDTYSNDKYIFSISEISDDTIYDENSPNKIISKNPVLVINSVKQQPNTLSYQQTTNKDYNNLNAFIYNSSVNTTINGKNALKTPTISWLKNNLSSFSLFIKTENGVVDYTNYDVIKIKTIDPITATRERTTFAGKNISSGKAYQTYSEPVTKDIIDFVYTDSSIDKISKIFGKSFDGCNIKIDNVNNLNQVWVRKVMSDDGVLKRSKKLVSIKTTKEYYPTVPYENVKQSILPKKNDTLHHIEKDERITYFTVKDVSINSSISCYDISALNTDGAVYHECALKIYDENSTDSSTYKDGYEILSITYDPSNRTSSLTIKQGSDQAAPNLTPNNNLYYKYPCYNASCGTVLLTLNDSTTGQQTLSTLKEGAIYRYYNDGKLNKKNGIYLIYRGTCELLLPKSINEIENIEEPAVLSEDEKDKDNPYIFGSITDGTDSDITVYYNDSENKSGGGSTTGSASFQTYDEEQSSNLDNNSDFIDINTNTRIVSLKSKKISVSKNSTITSGVDSCTFYAFDFWGSFGDIDISKNIGIDILNNGMNKFSGEGPDSISIDTGDFDVNDTENASIIKHKSFNLLYYYKQLFGVPKQRFNTKDGDYPIKCESIDTSTGNCIFSSAKLIIEYDNYYDKISPQINANQLGDADLKYTPIDVVYPSIDAQFFDAKEGLHFNGTNSSANENGDVIQILSYKGPYKIYDGEIQMKYEKGISDSSFDLTTNRYLLNESGDTISLKKSTSGDTIRIKELTEKITTPEYFVTTSLSLIKDFNPMTNCWFDDMYRKYTSYDSYTKENGIESGYEKNKFFASRGLSLRNSNNNTIEITSWSNPVISAKKKSITVDVTASVINYILNTEGFMSNWNVVSSASQKDKTKYIENSILKYLKINNSNKIIVYTNTDTSKLSLVNVDDLEKGSIITNVKNELSYENNKYKLTLSNLANSTYAIKMIIEL